MICVLSRFMSKPEKEAKNCNVAIVASNDSLEPSRNNDVSTNHQLHCRSVCSQGLPRSSPSKPPNRTRGNPQKTLSRGIRQNANYLPKRSMTSRIVSRDEYLPGRQPCNLCEHRLLMRSQINARTKTTQPAVCWDISCVASLVPRHLLFREGSPRDRFQRRHLI